MIWGILHMFCDVNYIMFDVGLGWVTSDYISRGLGWVYTVISWVGLSWVTENRHTAMSGLTDRRTDTPPVAEWRCSIAGRDKNV